MNAGPIEVPDRRRPRAGWHSSPLTERATNPRRATGPGSTALDADGADEGDVDVPGDEAPGVPTGPPDDPGRGGMTGPAGAGGEGGDPQLGQQVRRGLRWSFITQFGVRAVSFLAGIALFRILDPDDFGVYTLALGVVNILMSANDLGQVVAVMRWPGKVREVARTAASLALGTSVVMYAVAFVAAPTIAAAAERPGATGVLRVLALIVVVDGLTATPRALLFRSFRQDRLAAGELAGVPVNLALSVGLALSGAGAWAPAIGSIAGALVNGTAVLWLAPSFPLPGWDRDAARPSTPSPGP